MNRVIMLALLALLPLTGVDAGDARRTPAVSVAGPAIGTAIPEFSGTDQDGTRWTFATLRGPKGAVIYFHRSADWCIYCKMELIELEKSRASLTKNGYSLVAVSFDSAASLKAFAGERGIHFPLLSDPGSQIIRSFGLLDESVAPGSPAYGVPVHGALLVDETGVVRSRFFDGNLGHASGVVLTRLFTSPYDTHEKLVLHNRLRLKYYAAQLQVRPGDTLQLTIDFALDDGIFIRAGDSGGNAAGFSWEMDESPGYRVLPVQLPNPRVEQVATHDDETGVHRGHVRIVRELVFDKDPARVRSLMQPGGELFINGTLRFEACDAEHCYSQRKVPLRWTIDLGESRTTTASRNPAATF